MSHVMSALGRDVRVSRTGVALSAMSIRGDMRWIVGNRKRPRLQKMLTRLHFKRCNVVTCTESV